jgi:hypothetical protein
MHRAVLINIRGRSFRMREHQAFIERMRKEVGSTISGTGRAPGSPRISVIRNAIFDRRHLGRKHGLCEQGRNQVGLSASVRGARERSYKAQRGSSLLPEVLLSFALARPGEIRVPSAQAHDMAGPEEVLEQIELSSNGRNG